MIQEPIQPTSSPARRGPRRRTRLAAPVVAAGHRAVLPARGPVVDRGRGGTMRQALGSVASAAPRHRPGPRRRSRRQGPDRRTTAAQGHRPRLDKGSRARRRTRPSAARSRIKRDRRPESRSRTEDGWTRTITDDRRHQVITKGGQPIAVWPACQGRRRDPLQPDPQRRRVVHDHRDRRSRPQSPAARSRPSTRRPSRSRARRDTTQVITVTGATVYQLGKATGDQGGRQGRRRT